MFIFPIVGILLIAFGLLFLFQPKYLLTITRIANKMVPVDQLLFKHRYLMGAFLLLAAAVMYYIARTTAGENDLITVLAAVFGILFLLFSILMIFMPSWMEKINEVGGKVIATDEVTLVYRKSTGALLILIGLYMFYIYMK